MSALLYVCIVITYSKGKDQPGKVAKGFFYFFLYRFAPENLVSRDGLDSFVPRQPAHLHTQAKSGAYGIPPEFRGGVLYLFKPPHAIGPIPNVSGRAIAYRWRLLPRVRRHRASEPQGPVNPKGQ